MYLLGNNANASPSAFLILLAAMDLCCCERSFSISLIATMGATVPHGKQASLGCSGSAVEVPGLSLREACGIFPDQGLNLCPLLWQVDRSHWTTRAGPALLTEWETLRWPRLTTT